MKVRTKKIEVSVGYAPTTLNFKKYELPRLILDSDGNEKKEAEEVIARILDYSREEKTWVAVSQSDFDTHVQEMHNLWEQKERLETANRLKIVKFRKERIQYYLLSILSLGLYNRTHKAPKLELHAEIPLKGIRTVLLKNNGPQFLEKFKETCSYLCKNDYINIKFDGMLYISPSEKLLELIENY
ncbi:hypothetical protein IJU97_02395 [bacterium]|nr:hypothetical protein [bacterium]